MNTEPDPLLRDLDRLRRSKGWCPLTPEEADIELARTPDAPMSQEEIDRLIAFATAGATDAEATDAGEPFPELEWNPDDELAGIDEEVFQLNRNVGDEDAEVEQLIDDHLRKALGDDEEDGRRV